MESIKRYLREHYTDERLNALLESARNGTLIFYSCCCLVGMATAPDDHTTHGLPSWTYQYAHYRDAVNLPGARDAEIEYAFLADNDVGRRAAIIPVILEEMERRKRERS